MIVTLQQAYNDIEFDISDKGDVREVVEALLETEEISEISIKFERTIADDNNYENIARKLGGYDE